MARTGRAIAGVVFLGAAVVIATGWWQASTASADDTISEPVRHVEIDSDGGTVSIRAADVETTEVHQEFRYHWNEPERAFEVGDGTLELTGCGWRCDVSYEVVVPLGTTVGGKSDSGSVALDAVGEVDIKVSSGEITLTAIDGPIRVDVDSGSVSGDALSGPITADVDSGEVDLTLARPNDVTADVDSGEFTLTVPDVPYRVDTEVDSGGEEIDVRTDPDARYLLDFDIDSGDLTVRAG